VFAVIDRGESGQLTDEGGSAQRRCSRFAMRALRGHARRTRGRSAGVLGVLLAASLMAGAPALAADQRGHVFSFAFGAPGTGTGQFSHPAAIAVNNATGEVYVADRENNRVEQFKSTLGKEGEPVGAEYVGAFSVPHPEQVAVDNCMSGSNPCTEAEDPSVGDVYVAGAVKVKSKGLEQVDPLVYKFSAAGVPVGEPHKFKSGVAGIALDPSGTLFVRREGGIDRFSNALINAAEGSVPISSQAQPGFAVDSKDNFYAGAALNPEEASEDEALKNVLNQLAGEYSALHHGQHLPIVAKREAATGNVLVPALAYEPTTAVAVNLAEEPSNAVAELNDAYVVNVANVAGEQVSTVAAYAPEAEGGSVVDKHGKLLQRFGAPGLREGDGVAVDSRTGTVYVADAAANAVDVFALEPSGPPTVDGSSATAEGAAQVTTLNAQVNPAGADTHAYFEYGTASCAASPGTCTRTAVADVGTGFGDRLARVELQNLQPGSYHYRAVAENAAGTVDGAEQTFEIAALVSGLPDGRAWEMVSPASKDGAEPEPITLEGGSIQAAVNGRAITYVADGPMPAGTEPEGSRSFEPTQILSTRGPEGWNSQDITTANSTGAGPAVGESPEYQAFSANLAVALVAPFNSNLGPLAGPPLSPPLPGEEGKQETTIYLRGDAPLQPEPSPEAVEEHENYEKARENGKDKQPTPNAGFLPLVTQLNRPGPEFGVTPIERGLVFEAATPDLSHVVLTSNRHNTPANSAASGLYEWGGTEREKKLSFISELPAPEKTRVPAGEAALGSNPTGKEGQALDVRHAVSNDGSLVFWTWSPKGFAHLYVRDTVHESTVQIDKVNPGAQPEELEKPPAPGPVFQTASANGSKVFFTDVQRLTAESKAVEGSPDLYVFELNPPPGQLPLKDLTAQEGAGVLVEKLGGGVLGASDDGSYVYFVADGALAPNATPGHCVRVDQPVPAGTTCNLYVRHYDAKALDWEPAKLIAVLSAADRPDWGKVEGRLPYVTSRVSPKGLYLAFMSERSLTGYNNEDVSSKSKGERLDEEVYLYNAVTGHVVCASCNPSGARPRGVFDAGGTAGGTGEGLGLVVDRRENWVSKPGHGTVDGWLGASVPGWTPINVSKASYQSRYLSDEGRLFFDSADPLVALATPTRTETVGGEQLAVGVENVYEYQRGGLGGCAQEGGCIGLISSGTSQHESAFLDASETGNDVFFLTAAPLAAQDLDTNYDVYDAHVCEVSAPCPPPPPPPGKGCQGEECQGAFTAGPSFPAPASATSSGPGNVGAQAQVLGSTQLVPKPKPKPLTRAQKFARALKACRKDKQKSKRLACERLARKRYGPITHKSTKNAGKGK
jgi:DNA-binding beta-propeller fold protein YncE